MPIPPLGETLRHAMRRWACGVTVVTARDGPRRAGMTVSAFLSVALEPPTVLVSLAAGTETLALASASGAYAVSLLGDGAQATSSRFAGYGLAPGQDRFEGSPTTEHVTGAPVLVEAIAWMDCRVRARHEHGTHVLLVGEVVAAGVADGPVSPLLYVDRGYRRLAPPTG